MKKNKRRDNKLKLVIAIVFPLTLIGLLLLAPWKTGSKTNNDSQQKSSGINSDRTESSSKAVAPDTLIIGDPDAKVTIVEYADFKCAQCGKFHETSGKQLRQEYIDSGKAKIEFRAFPIIGPDSARALRGAYCANQSDNFTSYHDNLFSYMWQNFYKNGDYEVGIEDILTEAVLTKIAVETGANEDDFAKCVASDEMNKFIDRDLAASSKDGVQGTPTFVIGGQKIVGSLPFNNFKTLIDINLR